MSDKELKSSEKTSFASDVVVTETTSNPIVSVESDVNAPSDSEESLSPSGAIIITTILGGVILLMWFSIFFLDLLRS